MTTATAAELAAPLAAYARRFHAGAGPGHHVGSPLGAWLALALCGPACAGPDRTALSEVLGCEIEIAADTAAALLSEPHPLVAAAAAAWHRDGVASAALADWQDRLPAAVATGVLPGPAQLDGWAREHSFGLIPRFPVRLTPDVGLLLATTLAARVSWQQPFDLAPASELGPGSPWAARLGQVLRTPGTPAGQGSGHQQFIAASQGAGAVAVHTAWAAGGLQVTSVAADPGVPAADVLAAAYDLATGLATGTPPARRSLFDLELGAGPLWTLTERPGRTRAPGGREERCTAVLPAWSATSTLDLDQPGLGFDVAGAGLAGLLGRPDLRYRASQACAARYSRTGFEAAALTVMAAGMALQLRPQGVIRTAELRFGHPFAVVAVVADEQAGDRRAPRPGRWHGLPVFSAWVSRPSDAG